MSKSVRTILLWILAAAWMTLIFGFSAQNADESNKVSGSTVELIVRGFVKDYDSLPEEKKEQMLDSLGTFIRKTAHFLEYAVLGIIYFLLIGEYTVKHRGLISFASAFIYACLDEIHQYFVPGRAARLFDVLIDSAGVLSGIAFICAVLRITSELKMKGTSKNE